MRQSDSLVEHPTRLEFIILGFVFCHPQQLLKGLPSSDVDCSDMPYSLTPDGRLDQGQNCLASAKSILPSLPNTHSARRSQLTIGALSLKGDYPHPTACNLPVYTSPASLPNRRNTWYKAPHVLPSWMPLAEVTSVRTWHTASPTSQRQLRLAYVRSNLIKIDGNSKSIDFFFSSLLPFENRGTSMGVYVNRTLKMKNIKAIGFDMDYTLVRYKTKRFELFSYENTINKLINLKGYSREIGKLQFDFDRVIQGVIIDKKRGNLLKVGRYGKVESAYHGLRPLEFKEQQRMYSGSVIDLMDANIQSLDTCFSISNGVLFAQLVDLKGRGLDLPDYQTIADDVRACLDLAHRDNSLKGEVLKRMDRFIIREPQLTPLLERYKKYGKKLLIITNSDYAYSKALLDFTITPFLKHHKCWSELFDILITYSQKPRFFTTRNNFLKIDRETGLMSNTEEKIEQGIFQGGCAEKLQEDLGLKGEEILYLGDHIYGDVIGIKKTFNWRTALVIEQLDDEVMAIKKSTSVQNKIDSLMQEKRKLGEELNEYYQYVEKANRKKKESKSKIGELFEEIETVNRKISKNITEYHKFFNPYWGEMMRSGLVESRFADQVEKYACIYMTKVSDLLVYYPHFYFRPFKRTMPHEC